MTHNYDMKEEWEKTKKQLVRFGKEVGELVRKGEDEIIILSQKGKIQIEATTATIKKEKLYYQIGKEYVTLSDGTKPSRTLKKLVDEYHKLEREQKTLNSKLKRRGAKKKATKATKTVRKTVAKKAAATVAKKAKKATTRKGVKKKATKKS